MTIELSNWFYEGVLMTGGVLSIDRAYFEITGGRERWLYKVARKHAGGAGEADLPSPSGHCSRRAAPRGNIVASSSKLQRSSIAMDCRATR